MSATPGARATGDVGRKGRRPGLLVGAVVALALTVGLVYAAAPANDWYLPGQTVTLRTSVENHVNGHLVVVGVADDGSVASVAVNSLSNERAVVAGDTVSLGLGQRLRVLSIDHVAPGPDGEVADGGVGTVIVRVTLW